MVLCVLSVLAVVRWVVGWVGGLGWCSVHSVLATVPPLGLFLGDWFLLAGVGVASVWGSCMWSWVVLWAVHLVGFRLVLCVPSSRGFRVACSQAAHLVLAMVPLLGLFPGNWMLTDLGVAGMWGRCVWRRVVLRVVGG